MIIRKVVLTMTREQVINFLKSSGISEEQIKEIILALVQQPSDNKKGGN